MEQTLECAICGERFNHGVTAVCRNGHHWCRRCLGDAAQAATRNITDASCMPPRCCGDAVLPTNGARDHRALRQLSAGVLAS
ncbi:hypothetical protein N656DRAFT_779991 [Canariomyces notabilis]|uniref:Uncharacterized protein n=1 Tax=Canariomyces notabilis TaxID=2074819 RepID=A0AAN6TCK9_9PEZI|nr:hypothetical protein N656DRAFT_779991 [Canariomyces arenarius]